MNKMEKELIELWRKRIQNPEYFEEDLLIEHWRKSIENGDYI